MLFDQHKGEHLFRSSLVQTLLYGVFSAWVEHARSGGGVFDWRMAEWSLHVPMVKTLFEQLAVPGKLKPLGLDEVLGWAADALNRVDRTAFFEKFDEAQAVRYFYEPFLAYFDAELRKELGVWYTPSEVVHYMVERVDRVLRTELGLVDGLANPSVYVLDPCCGTGTFLIEVLRRIETTLRTKGGDALLAQDLKTAATKRIAGFEIMPAPFVITHWQIGALLKRAGAPLSDETGERAAVYLTNALTGWDAPKVDAPHLPIVELEQERDAAGNVKRDVPILVIIGNPPYNAFAGTSPAEEGGLVEPYKEGLQSEWGIKKFSLDDLYVRFFRIAERRIVDITKRGVICLISNHSYLWYPSYVIMRRRFCQEFDRIWIDNLNGSKFETGKLTPDGRSDPSVFSTDYNREGIQVGTAIGLFVKSTETGATTRIVRYRDLWGETKRADLVSSLRSEVFDDLYRLSLPGADNRFAFRPTATTAQYMQWPRISELGRIKPLNGLMEKRAGSLIDSDRAALSRRLQVYFDRESEWAAIRRELPGLAKDAGRFDAQKTRRKAVAAEAFSERAIRPYYLRPFDYRWAYVTLVRPIWNEPRPELVHTLPDSHGFLVTRPGAVASPEGGPVTWTVALGDNDALRGHAYYFPVVENLSGARRPNLSAGVRAWLSTLGFSNADTDLDLAALPWLHALAVAYSPAWLAENADGIRKDWPRVPLPSTADLLRASAELGRQLAGLLDVSTQVEGVTAGAIRPELSGIAVLTKRGDKQIESAEDLSVTAGWGHAGKNDATMPGRGRSEVREYTPDEAATADHAAILGRKTVDVFLNADVYWRNIPECVWDFHVGGYQVLKKWLSYREREIMDRPLAPEEARYITSTARRLAAILLLSAALDDNFNACAATAASLPSILDHDKAQPKRRRPKHHKR